jgi:circadian clock protein KaiB
MAATRTRTRARSRKPASANGAAARVRRPLKTPQAWKLRLFVAGQTAKSIRAVANLKVLCDEHLKGRYEIEVIDLLEQPHMARGAQIVAVPTLDIKLPQSVQRIIGDLSNTERVLVGLALQKID